MTTEAALKAWDTRRKNAALKKTPAVKKPKPKKVVAKKAPKAKKK